MTTCIARRAHADRTSFRLYKEEGGIVKEGKYIWTEYCCPNVASEGNERCTECRVKLPNYKYQSAPKCDHGLVGGPYPSDSKLYGSPFYLKHIKDGWKIREADELRAKEFQQKAISSMGRKPKPATDTVATTQVEGQEQEQVPVKAKQPRKPRTIKVKAVAEVVQPTPELPPASGQALFVESSSVPLKVTDVITVKVKKIRCEGKEYYLDSVSSKLYGVSVNGVGPYKGRYNSESETMDTRYPDSDVEV
jgi:hypothetical protein